MKNKICNILDGKYFWYFLLFGSVDIQHFTIRKQILKKKIMMTVGACIFLIAAANALPLFFGIGG